MYAPTRANIPSIAALPLSFSAFSVMNFLANSIISKLDLISINYSLEFSNDVVFSTKLVSLKDNSSMDFY